MAERVVRETVTRDADDAVIVREDGDNLVARIVWLIAGIILILLAFRFILSLLGANPANAFADFIYDASYPFVAPFFGLFSYDNIQYGVSRFEIYTLVAMLVYAALAWLLTYVATMGHRA